MSVLSNVECHASVVVVDFAVRPGRRAARPLVQLPQAPLVLQQPILQTAEPPSSVFGRVVTDRKGSTPCFAR